MFFADVIIDISHEKLDKSFQYRIPEELCGKIQVGMQVVIPFGGGSRRITGYVVGISETPKIELSRIKDIISIDSDSIKIESQLIALAAWIKEHYGATMNQALKTVIPIKQKTALKERKFVHLKLNRDEANDAYAKLINRAKHSVAKERLLLALMEEEVIPWDIITGKLNVPSTVIRDFEKAGYIYITSERAYRNPVKSLEKTDSRHMLNTEQTDVVDAVISDMRDGVHKTYLLYGVTGSGKTEVYMELIEETLSAGKEAIVLIPEIALTYQTVMRFYDRFGDKVSIMNSRMTPGERFDQFERAKVSDCKIMVGPRSALFTPFPNLGLIIIDEEHESSYKSEQVPKYHARETAVKRGQLAGATVVLGSATPSLESYNRALNGEYEMLRLTKRVEERSLPECEIIDLRAELKEGNRSILSRRLQELLKDRLEKNEQAMLFINRRGLMGFVSCRACGEAIKCPHCDVSLSLHRDNKLHCHYCGYSEPMPKICPKCGSKYIGGFRAGTEMIEDAVKEMFPEARVLRMDADTTKGKDGHEEILSKFANREADVLVGTQMIVKGHDFPDVTLMGVLAADMSLNSSDYHGAERTFQLLTQAAGRAGRGDRPGNVVIQTYQPEHYSILLAAKQDYDAFFSQEIAYRSLLDYPPASHMLLMLITSEVENQAEGLSKSISDLIREKASDVVTNGPLVPGISKLQDIYRRTVYCKDANYDRLIFVKDIIEKYMLEENSYYKAYVFFDFDPISGF